MKVSVYRNSFQKTGVIVSLDAVVQRIQTGDRGLAEKTRQCNKLAIDAPASYKEYKENHLPAVTFSGIFPAGKRKAKYLKLHSGYIVLDLDGLTAEQITDLLADLAQHPYIRIAFISPSAEGIKVVVRVDPIPQNDLEHKGAYAACLDFFDDLAEEYGFTIDTSGKDCSRLCYLAHDPLVIVHTDAPAIGWDRAAWITAEQLKQERFDAAAKKPYTGDVDITALDHIDPNDLDYNQWLSVITACKAAGFSWQQADAWSRRGGVRYQEGEVETRWSGLNLSVSWGAVVNLAKLNGYTPPAPQKRYQINTEHLHATSDLETERKANKNVVVQWLQETEKKKGKHLLILGSAAGTAKTTVGIFTPDGLLYIAKTTEEADKVFQELYQAEEDVVRHRPRMFNRGHKDIDGNNDWETLPLGLGEHDRPCIHPETCNLMAERGHSPTLFCVSKCSVYADCTEKYFLSQAEKEKNASKVIYAWGEDMAVDAQLAKYIKRICAKGDVLIVDEVNPLELTQQRKMNRDILFDLVERFRHPHEKTEDIYTKLKALLDHQSTAETPEKFIAGIQQWIDGIENIEALNKQIERYPVGMVFRNTPENAEHKQPFEATLEYLSKSVTVPVVDHETADDTPAYQIDPETPIETDKYQVEFVSFGFLRKVGLATFDDPPRRHRNFLTDLKTFFDENTNIETAPFAFDPKQQTFEFHLKPTLNHHRVIFNTASDPDNLIGEAYRETDINITRHTGTPPSWKTDLVFQISSGNYLPRQSLIRQEGEGEDKVLYLKPRTQEIVDAFIRPSIEAGLKVFVVAPKAFQEVESVTEWAVTELDDHIQGCNAVLVNHHHAEGRNDYQDFESVFVFHYEPNHNELPLATKRIYRNPETPLDFTREKRTVTLGGVSFEKVIYVDERVQAVYNRECRQRLMQSAMRLRPNIHEGKIIVFLTAEPVDIPVTPMPFSLKDAKHFTGDWAALKAKLQATVEERIAKGDSQSKAYRDTEQKRTQDKAERDAEIHRRYYTEKQTQPEIADDMGINKATVWRVLEKMKF